MGRRHHRSGYGHASLTLQNKIRREYSAGNDCHEGNCQDNGNQGQFLLKRGKGFRKALDILKWAQHPHSHPGHRASEKSTVEKIADVAVFLLQYTKRAMVRGEFIKVRGNEGHNGGNGNDKLGEAQDTEEITAFVFQIKIESRRCIGRQNHIKSEFHGDRRQGRKVSGQGFIGRAEERPAAGCDDVGIKKQEIFCL
jgi:hypothetical protein